VIVGRATADTSIYANAFFPQAIEIGVGDTVTWTFEGVHNVAFLGGGAAPPFSVLEGDKMYWMTIYRGEMRNAAEMYRAGMTLLAGTDVGSPLLVPGFSLHDELDLLVSQARMTPLQALQAATILPSRVMGLADSLSSVAVGKVADLVVLDASPLVAIGNARRIHAVIANGRLLTRDALQRMLATAEAAAR
jgi:hypothetical protein